MIQVAGESIRKRILKDATSKKLSCGDTVKVLQIWWGGKLLDILQVSPHGYNDQHMGWHNSLVYATHTAVKLKFPYVVRASANVTRLEFVSQTSGNCGAVIDLVSVV